MAKIHFAVMQKRLAELMDEIDRNDWSTWGTSEEPRGPMFDQRIREKDDLIKSYENLTLRLIYKATDKMYALPSQYYGGNFKSLLAELEDWLDHLKISAAKDVGDLTPSDYWRPDRPYKTLNDQIATFEAIIPMLTRASKIWDIIYK